MENWVMPLDALAAGGVIDFDAAAFLLEQKPRYIGHPSMERLPLENPMYLEKGIKLKDVPEADILEKSEDKNLVHNPTWKKALFGTVIGTGVLFAGLAAFKGLSSFKFPTFSMPKISTPKLKMPKMDTVKDFFSNAFKSLKKPFTNILKKLKK